MKGDVVYTKDLVYNRKYPEVITVNEAHIIDGFRVHVRFSDNTEKEIDLEPLLWGAVFEPIRNNPERFREMYIDPEGKTIAWPGDIDLAPETLYYGDQEPPWYKDWKKRQAPEKRRPARKPAAPAKRASGANGRGAANKSKPGKTSAATKVVKGVKTSTLRARKTIKRRVASRKS